MLLPFRPEGGLGTRCATRRVQTVSRPVSSPVGRLALAPPHLRARCVHRAGTCSPARAWREASAAARRRHSAPARRRALPGQGGRPSGGAARELEGRETPVFFTTKPSTEDPFCSYFAQIETRLPDRVVL